MNNKFPFLIFLLLLFSCGEKKDFGYTTPPPFELPQYNPEADTLLLYPVKYQHSYGYIDKNGKMIIEPQFEQAYDFEEGIAMVFFYAGRTATEVGYIDKKGNIIWKEDDLTGYQSTIGDFRDGLLPYIYYENYIHKHGYINRKGKIVIPAFFDGAGNFSEGMARVCMHYPEITSEEEKNNLITGVEKKKRERWGFINTKGELVVPFKYNEVYDFKNGYAHVLKIEESKITDQYVIMNGGRHGFIDKTGWPVIPLIYEDVQDFSEGLAPVKWKGKWGFINEKGEMIIPPAFDMAAPFLNGMAMVGKTDADFNEKYGYINKKGTLVIPFRYDYAMDFENGMACVSMGEKNGCINTNGEWVIEPRFDGLIFFSEGIGLTGFDGKYGFIDTTGLWIAQPIFSDARVFKNGLAPVLFNGYYGHPEKYTELGYINREGKYVWEPQW
ncbi:MAG: WG repeat-containing protein [Bacteroidota bacterium]